MTFAAHTLAEAFALRFPLTERALDRLARSFTLHMWRTLGVFVGWIILFTNAAPMDELVKSGQALDKFALVFQIIAIIGVVLVRTPNAIAKERSERTLELLLIADFRRIDILTSQFAAIAGELLTLLVLPVPFLAAASFLGGISVPETAFRFCVMACTGLAATAVGLAMSAQSESSDSASTRTAAIIFVWWGGGTLLDYTNWLPFRFAPWSVLGSPTMSEFGQLAALCAAVIVCSAIAAMGGLLRNREQTRRPAPIRPPKSTPASDEEATNRMVDAASGAARSRERSPVRLFVAMPLVWIFAAIPLFGSIAFLLIVFYNVATQTAWWHRRNEVDLLSVTPVDEGLLKRKTLTHQLWANVLFFPGFCFATPAYLILLASALEGPSGTLAPLWYLALLFPLGLLGYVGGIAFAVGVSQRDPNPATTAIHGLFLYAFTMGGLYFLYVIVISIVASTGAFAQWNIFGAWFAANIMAHFIANAALFHIGWGNLENGIHAKLRRN